MLKKIAVGLASSALVLASTAQAGAASLSLQNVARASTASEKDNALAPVTVGIIAAVAMVAMLEAGGAINLIGGSDDADSN